MVNLKDQTPPSAVPDQWYQVRKENCGHAADFAGGYPGAVLQ